MKPLLIMTDYPFFTISPYTVAAQYHDNGQFCLHHVTALDPEDASDTAQILVHNEMRQANINDPDNEYRELKPNEVPDHLKILAVFDGHLTAVLSFD